MVFWSNCRFGLHFWMPIEKFEIDQIQNDRLSPIIYFNIADQQ